MSSKLDAAHSILRQTGVPRGWSDFAVGDVVRIVGGGTPDREQSVYWRDGRIPWITPTDLTNNEGRFISSGAESISEIGLRNSNATLVPPGAVVFSTRGTVGNIAVAEIPLTTNQSCETLVPRDKQCSGDFLYYLLNFGMSAFHRLSGGTTFGAITRRDISRVRFAFPPPEEQAAIARILDAVDTAIERTRDAIARARELRRALLGDLLHRGIGSDGCLRKPSGPFNRTPIGRLPKAWRLSSVGEEFGVQSGLTINAGKEGLFKKYPYLRVANVQRDHINLNDVQKLEATPAQYGLRALEENDLLVVEGHADRLQIGRCALVGPEAAGMTFQNHLFRLRARDGVCPQFVCLWLNSDFGKAYWNARCATSSGLNTINQRMLKRLPIPVPDLGEQVTIAGIAQAQRNHLESLLAKADALGALKRSLMHDLLTGRVRTTALIESKLREASVA